MLWVPVPRLLVPQTAVRALVVPPVKATALQPLIVLPPSVKATLPVGAVPVTVAVKVTLVPTTTGLAELANAAVLVALFTVCVSVLLVDPVLPLSPP